MQENATLQKKNSHYAKMKIMQRAYFSPEWMQLNKGLFESPAKVFFKDIQILRQPCILDITKVWYGFMLVCMGGCVG